MFFFHGPKVSMLLAGKIFFYIIKAREIDLILPYVLGCSSQILESKCVYIEKNLRKIH